MTGVPVMPYVGLMPVFSTSWEGTGVMPFAGSMKLSCQSTPLCRGPAVGLLASRA